MRLKLISNNTPMERRFNPWIGGSILASLVSSEFLFSFFLCDKKGEERLCRKAVIPYRLVSSVVIKRVKAVKLLTE